MDIELFRLSEAQKPRDLIFMMEVNGQTREVCRFSTVHGQLDIKVPDDLPMTRAARLFLAVLKEVHGGL